MCARTRDLTVLAFVFALAFTPTPSAAAEGGLIKLTCPSGAAADHPCKAVYFHGHDGKRHAFPNEKVYFSWYADFSGVQSLSSTALAAIPLGRNVTYRPGARMVKFQTDPEVFAVALGGELRGIASEALAASLYGADWNTKIDDIPDPFFGDYRFGTDIVEARDYDPSVELAYAPDIDADLPATRVRTNVSASTDSFDVDRIVLHRGRFSMRTGVAHDGDCGNGCAAYPLAEHAARYGAQIGIHGSYFCPPDYADCATKVNSFLAPFYDSARDFMANEKSLAVHKGPVMASSTDGRWFFYRTAKDFGVSIGAFETRENATLQAAASNYPALMEDGQVVVLQEPRYEDAMKTKATRGGLAWNDRFVYLLIVRGASVEDLARVMDALGATDGMNLDGGGSVAMLFDGKYRVGPGRLLPNAILFVPR